MPVSPKLALRLALELRGLYEAATNDLIRAIAVQVGRGAQDATWQDRKLEALTLLMHDVDRTIDDLRREVPGAVERALGYAYRRGGAVASVEAEAAGITGSFGFMPDEEALTRLLSEAMRPHEQVILGIRRSVNDAYDQALVRAAATVLTGTGTRVDAARSALSFLADQGITGFTDRSGRKWDMASYAEMATRTSSGHAAIEGHMDRLTGLGVDTVYVSDSPEECDLCREWESSILSISGKTVGDTLSDGKKVKASVAEARSAGLYHPNAILGDHSLEAIGGINGAVRSWYEGPSIELTTASGVRFTVSPNHPVLTSRGWLAAERLSKGDQLFHAADGRRGFDGPEVHEALDDVVTGVADQFDALLAVGSHMSIPASGDDLHGDGKFCQGEIDVVVTNDGLLPVGDSEAVEDSRNLVLGRSGVELHGGSRLGSLHLGFHGVGSSVGRALPNRLTSGLEPSEKGHPADAEDPGEVIARLPGAVEVDELVDVNRDWFRGHAYDFQTGFGAYFLNSILVHNCTHSQSIYLPGITEPPTDTEDADDYDLRQRQRAYERRIRKWKRRVELEEAVTGKNDPHAKQARKKLRDVQAEFRQWRTQNDRRAVTQRTNLHVR